jgi:hypothetical protein
MLEKNSAKYEYSLDVKMVVYACLLENSDAMLKLEFCDYHVML